MHVDEENYKLKTNGSRVNRQLQMVPFSLAVYLLHKDKLKSNKKLQFQEMNKMPCQFLLFGVGLQSRTGSKEGGFTLPFFSGDHICIQSFHGNSWETLAQ